MSTATHSKRHHHHHHHHHAFVTTSGGGGAVKRTNRHFASLDFLLNIPMRNEGAIIASGIAKITKLHGGDDNGEHLDALRREAFQKVMSTMNIMTDETLLNSPDMAGRKLQGSYAPLARVPIEYRHNLSRLSEMSAVVRQWEDQLLIRGFTNTSAKGIQQPLLSSRMFFTRARAYPVATMSIIKYDAGQEAKKLSKLKAVDQKGLEVYVIPTRDWRGFSYKPLFKPIVETNEYYQEHGFLHDPNVLDDPNMLHGSHRYVLGRSAVTGPVVSSIILYVNKTELKESLNNRFHELHPQLPPSLTLSKIRNIKKAALLACLELDIEIATVAMAVIYFERLCLKCLVTKLNRHLSMSVCLVLAYKFNEHFVTKEDKDKMEKLLEFFDREWEIPRKEIFRAEFGAYVHLGFSLDLPQQHVHIVYMRLLKLVNKSNRAYLGEDMENVYTDFVLLEREAKYKELEDRNDR
jgi:hypothetical protein